MVIYGWTKPNAWKSWKKKMPDSKKLLAESELDKTILREVSSGYH